MGERAAVRGTENLTPVSWLLAGGTHPFTLDRMTQAAGSVLWAVHRGASVLTVDGTWEYECRPGERDEAFRARCRFATAAEALAAWDKVRGGRKAA